MKNPGFWRLFGAYGIDILILLILNFGYYMWEVHSSISSFPWLKSALINLVIFVLLNAGYFAVLEWKGKGSLGKKLFHLKIQVSKPSFFRVFSAYGLECVAFFAVIWGIMILTASFIWNDMEKMVLWFLSGWLGGAVLICFYYSISEGLFGKSLGKKLFGLQVVREETK